jgi:hypothetical protein
MSQQGENPVMKLSLKNQNHCLYCGRQLSVLHRLRDLLYCDNSHRSAHSREVNQLALARLLPEAKSSSEIRWKECERRMKVADLRQSA